ncbi:hypothetical protein DWW50_09780 [Eubacterium sp. AF15-50]|jgi:hypothetical protein|uniref:PBECR3 domain-containing polyvalent protein n=1 Tax=unclassified Eubacterium (in: firmicutes) TaxID=2624479 RepID=UPI000E49AE48|nr:MULTISPECIES: hypothetical protein [unclassified Eubacterium (in: firmicutes)]RHR72593.1 hypothetical protein DWW68_06295 [Eubacterium sp. AF16-48]RHR77849.1 hypothetical protein DWW50_09780 [Eubacterium sp. AF15-50]
MNNNIKPIINTPNIFSEYYEFISGYDYIYKSEGLVKHIEKRHPECIDYLSKLEEIISFPDYIGINPNEKEKSFELVKIFDANIQIGIKLDVSKDYLYVATLHTITNSKLQHRLKNGRLKKFDK